MCWWADSFAFALVISCQKHLRVQLVACRPPPPPLLARPRAVPPRAQRRRPALGPPGSPRALALRFLLASLQLYPSLVLPRVLTDFLKDLQQDQNKLCHTHRCYQPPLSPLFSAAILGGLMISSEARHSNG